MTTKATLVKSPNGKYLFVGRNLPSDLTERACPDTGVSLPCAHETLDDAVNAAQAIGFTDFVLLK